jgi:hypothetical protein
MAIKVNWTVVNQQFRHDLHHTQMLPFPFCTALFTFFQSDLMTGRFYCLSVTSDSAS